MNYSNVPMQRVTAKAIDFNTLNTQRKTPQDPLACQLNDKPVMRNGKPATTLDTHLLIGELFQGAIYDQANSAFKLTNGRTVKVSNNIDMQVIRMSNEIYEDFKINGHKPTWYKEATKEVHDCIDMMNYKKPVLYGV